MRDVKAVQLLKYNIDALLRARGQTRRELATYCHRTEAWMSQIFTHDERGIPLKYLDRIADFFGIATYQLLQPGISPLTERRTGFDRRKLRDRRLSAAVLSEKRGDTDLVDIIRVLNDQNRGDILLMARDRLHAQIDALRPSRSATGPPGALGRTAQSTEGGARGQKRETKP